MEMKEMSWACEMGHTIRGKTEAELVKAAQEHMRNEHGKEISREEVMRNAKHMG